MCNLQDDSGQHLAAAGFSVFHNPAAVQLPLQH